MKLSFPPAALLVTIILGACSHPIEIIGQGDVDSASGTRDCTLTDYQAGKANCRENMVVEAYAETFRAGPLGGWRFDHWDNYCTDGITGDRCSFNLSADTVKQFWGRSEGVCRSVINGSKEQVKRYKAERRGQERLQSKPDAGVGL